MKIKVVCFLDQDQGRDVEILMPIIYFAERYLSCQVDFQINWDLHQIYLTKPDLVLLPNTVGSPAYFQLAKYANESNIPVFACVSEGNFRTNGTFDYWGYNLDKRYYQETVCLWSERTLNFLQKAVPKQASKMKLTGASGFDRYKIYQFGTKSHFFNKYNLKPYKKVVGYAGWAFGKLFNKQGREELISVAPDNPNWLLWIEKQMHLVEENLRFVIEQNPDILFILKRHPNEANQSITAELPNEMIGLKNLPNVFYVKENISIHEVLSVSDLWLAFESTSALEGWLMDDKISIFINPEPDFNRDEIYKGCIISKTKEELNDLINRFYLEGNLSEFFENEKIEARKKIIENTIGFSDGLNHLRAGFYLKGVVEKISQSSIKPKVSFKLKFFMKHLFVKFFQLFFNESIYVKIPILKKHVWIFKIFNFKNTKKLKIKYFKYLDDFYLKNNLNNKLSDSIYWKQLTNEN